MVEWRTGDNITESITIIIGGDTLKCDLYEDDGQEKMGVTEIRKDLVFLVFTSLSLDYCNRIKIYEWIQIRCII